MVGDFQIWILLDFPRFDTLFNELMTDACYINFLTVLVFKFDNNFLKLFTLNLL